VTEDKFTITKLNEIALDAEEKAASDKLRTLFQSYGSDKSLSLLATSLYVKIGPQ
jgi:hypothetical protein